MCPKSAVNSQSDFYTRQHFGIRNKLKKIENARSTILEPYSKFSLTPMGVLAPRVCAHLTQPLCPPLT